KSGVICLSCRVRTPCAPHFIPKKGTPMSAETVSPELPDAGDPHPFEPESPISEQNFINFESEAEATAEKDHPLGGSKANALKHGLSGSGKVMTLRDQAECDRQFQNLCDELGPQTPHQEDLLRMVASERTLLARCQNHLFGINEMMILRAEGHWK